jgi:hypothetical protein
VNSSTGPSSGTCPTYAGPFATTRSTTTLTDPTARYPGAETAPPPSQPPSMPKLCRKPCGQHCFAPHPDLTNVDALGFQDTGFDFYEIGHARTAARSTSLSH